MRTASISASIDYRPVDLTTVIYRRPDRSWWADVQLSLPWQVGDLRGMENDPGPGRWERNDQYVWAAGTLAVVATVVYLVK